VSEATSTSVRRPPLYFSVTANFNRSLEYGTSTSKERQLKNSNFAVELMDFIVRDLKAKGRGMTVLFLFRASIFLPTRRASPRVTSPPPHPISKQAIPGRRPTLSKPALSRAGIASQIKRGALTQEREAV
jgi:hypothetical protein